jgi:hypothetical protein
MLDLTLITAIVNSTQRTPNIRAVIPYPSLTMLVNSASIAAMYSAALS